MPATFGADRLRLPAVMAGLLALGACDMPDPAGDAAPQESPAPPETGREQGAVNVPAPGSAALAAYYAALERDRRGRGLMRTDGAETAGRIAPSQLAENFMRIAMREEHRRVDGVIRASGGEGVLRRWQGPVRMRLEFGDSVPGPVRSSDRQAVSEYAERLQRITGHPVSLTQGEGNFHVLVLGEDERRNAGPRLRELMPGIDAQTVRLITGLPRSALCMVAAFSRDEGPAYTDAVAVIRAEHPDLTRLSCYHEELAQGLGLPNDDDTVRPSIFNDTEEYALLTWHDELLLRMLYDSRLRPGMTPAQAEPIVRRLAREIAGAQS